MKCPLCGRETDSDAMFCTVCGRKIPKCPTCGTVIYQRSQFCERDGTPLPPELFAGFPPEQAPPPAPPAAEAAPAGMPAGGPLLPPPVLPKEKMGSGPLIAIIVLAVLLLAAAGGYFFLRGNPASHFGKEDAAPVSSESRDREDADKAPEDDPVETVLAQAKDCADDGRYEKALEKIESALEEHPKSNELLEARLAYIAALEADTLERAEALAESEDYLAAVQFIREALEVLGGESERLSDKEREYYEKFYIADIITQADQLVEGQRADEAEALLSEAAALFPENEDLHEKLRQLGEASESIGSSAVPISMDAVESVTATSYLSQANLNLYHTPGRTVDGDLSTAWVEGASGDGIGESITFTFDGVYLVSGMRIYAGYQKSADLYSKNARPAVLTVRFSDGSEQTVTLQDVNGSQDISFDGPAETSSITLTIASAYPGSKYEDTVISELSFY